MPGNVDRRPWLIISAAEGRALLEVALAEAQPSADLRRAHLGAAEPTALAPGG
jgi:hypothetical protein